ncbi:hypothetical protein DER29_5999 [Micromonospora sp. M71_S20]|uniref:hypothetical protein n=1 Tax=Micromonospora sp. M71_S20 TaxID=592872 RepID=UPI000F29ECC9|nr:hypothetical protein [Micromonospora sp. M71_S20]RLK09497.1 hypothetical protein DER29_5999 [Micromonospora sp. M71_S20]
MPARTETPAATLVANMVAAVEDRTAELGRPAAIIAVAQAHGLPARTVERWAGRAICVQTAPVPPGLLICQPCGRQMILLHDSDGSLAYLCAPACGRAPMPAAVIRDEVAAAILRRVPHLVPKRQRDRAADYATGAIQRVRVGITGLTIDWRESLLPVVAPRISMAQRLTRATECAHDGQHGRAIDLLRTGLAYVDPHHGPARDGASAQAGALLARLLLADGDVHTALLWATWAHQSLRQLQPHRTAVETRTALHVLAAAQHRTNRLADATTSYMDLIGLHTDAEGPTARATLTAHAALADVLANAGNCDQAQRLLVRTITIYSRSYPDGPSRAAVTQMRTALHRIRATCVAHHPHHQATRAP